MKGFFAGALFAAPLTAIVMWLVVGQQATIDTKVERGVTSGALAEAEFVRSFDDRWEQLGGRPALKCSPEDADNVAILRDRLAALEKELEEHRAADSGRAASINDIVVGDGK